MLYKFVHYLLAAGDESCNPIIQFNACHFFVSVLFVRFAQSLVFCLVFCRLLNVFPPVSFAHSLYCLSFLDLWLLITGIFKLFFFFHQILLSIFFYELRIANNYQLIILIK